MIHSTPSRLWAGHPQRRRWPSLLGAALLALTLAVVGQVAISGALWAADSLTLSQPWRFVDESKPGSPEISGGLEAATADAPAPVAARFELSSTMQALALQLSDGALGGLSLAQLKELSYCTRLIDSPLPYAVTLQVNIDTDVTDGDKSWQGRLVYTPADNGAIIQNEWQCWDTLAGKWWATGGPLAEFAKESSPQPLSSLLAHFPHLGVNAAYSVMALKAGAGWSRFQGEATPVVIGVEGSTIDVAFASTPNDAAQKEQVLLPALLNAPTPAAAPQNRGRKNDSKQNEKKQDDPKQGKVDKKLDWRATDWAATRWSGFDWQHFDWDKVDWAHLNWSAFGWGDSAHAEAIRAFVTDVQTCKDNGWQAAGFHSAGDCVAYYIKAHAPAEFDWSKYGWGRMWMYHTGNDNHSPRHSFGRHGDDN